MRRTINLRRPSAADRELRDRWLTDDDMAASYPAVGHPEMRGDCLYGPRPCPLVGCRYNLFLDVNERNGSIKFTHPDREPWEVPASESCALDLADAHPAGVDLPVLAEVAGLSYDRTWQVVDEARKRAIALAIEADIVDQLHKRTYLNK
jgi:hypothetical protein